MKVLQINSVCGIGSTGRITTAIHNILIEQGHESYIAYGRLQPKNCDYTIKIGNQFGVYMHGAKTLFFDTHGFGSKKATYGLIDKVKKIDPDIIHLHNIHGYYINIDILFDYLEGSGKPVVWTLHDCWAFTGHCAYFDYIGCNRWLEGCHDCPNKKAYPSSYFFDNSKDNYAKKKEILTRCHNLTITTPSKWLANLVRQSFLGQYPVHVIYNGIDHNVFHPSASDFRNKYQLKDKFIILGVANVWDERKGLKTFIDIAERMGEPFKITLVGLSPKQCKQLPDNIICIERTNDIMELSQIYSDADVFLNASVEETMGLVTVEALACGTPVVVRNATAVPEVVNNKCAVVLKDNSTEEIMRKITELKDHNPFKESDCIDQAKRFDNKKMCVEYLNLYKGIVQS